MFCLIKISTNLRYSSWINRYSSADGSVLSALCSGSKRILRSLQEGLLCKLQRQDWRICRQLWETTVIFVRFGWRSNPQEDRYAALPISCIWHWTRWKRLLWGDGSYSFVMRAVNLLLGLVHLVDLAGRVLLDGKKFVSPCGFFQQLCTCRHDVKALSSRLFSNKRPRCREKSRHKSV